MFKKVFRNWETINTWHFVWIGVIASEILTTLLSVAISLALWGSVSRQILIVGFFDAFIVSFIVVFITIYFVRRTSSLSEINQRLHNEVDEREKSEEALRESEERLKAIFENAKEGILVVDAETRRFINANIMICQMLGYSCEEIKKLSVSDIHPEADLPFVIGQFEKLLKQELSLARNIPIKRKDGTVFYAEINSSPFKLGGKNYLAGFFRDITENHKLEEQLRQSQKIAAVGILAGGVAHEFSNILTTLKGSVYIIQKKLAKEDSLNKYSEQITASLNKASDLAQGLLAFSRKQIVDLRPQNLSEIVMTVKTLLSSLIGEHIDLTIELKAGDLDIIADSNQMEQVLINLITNAMDAMPNGGQLTIRTDIQKIDEDFKKEHGFGVPGEYAVISISDTGTGMLGSIREQIFEPFFTTKELGKGTGLGLSIVYGIVKQHNGYIDFDTVPDKGTTFKIYIPAIEPKSAETPRQMPQSVIGGAETILLAEDDADAREIMGEVLRAEGYKVLEATDGEDATRKFRENREEIHLALLDVRMPKKDGREVYDEIRRMRPDIKSLFISGYTADVLDKDEFSELGLNFISKSSTPEEILGKIREVLDQPVSGL